MSKYINIKGKVYKVKKYKQEEKLRSGNAYKIGNIILPYKGMIESKDEIDGPGIYNLNVSDLFEPEFRHTIVKPLKKKKYSMDNVYEIDEDYIKEIIKTDGLIDDNDDIAASSSDEFFAPAINDEDNAPQKLIKAALANKQIDIKAYGSRFKSQTDLNNHKRGLQHNNIMSFQKFDTWCEILDLDYTLIIRDKNSAKNKMDKDISYDSEERKLEEL